MDASKTAQQPEEKTAKGNPLQKEADKVKTAFQAHSANPGPAIPSEFNVKEEGTKEERRAKAQELNK
ncbi:hypothetical protein C8A05DRAFT_31164 [Staphylotrichum tortipilum]|uniref:Uncharacterized protein n=1 Tax=Staphylotrichum tortipilum TaxID=2831512 RepID=A0AAN6MRA2_9PEZI|nr:hypothetical protein C8A05DRAFT_31164 [Staphylotrichum longicolle]